MSKIDLLPSAGEYYKANLHCHTIHSDGKLTPAEIKKYYLEQGYSVVAITDHRKYIWHKELTDDTFLTLAAFEADINGADGGTGDFLRTKTYHFNFYDMDPIISKAVEQPRQKYEDTCYINRYIEEMKTAGFMGCYNHPYWSLQSSEDYQDLQGLWAMEIYNYGCEHDGLYGCHSQCYDEMLRSGQRLFCLSTDDNHNGYPFGHPFCDSFGGFTMIRAEELSYPAIIKALTRGEFYSSMGPEIYEMSLTGKMLKIRTSPVEKIYVTTQGRNCLRTAINAGQTITEAEFEISGKEGYLRLDVRDEKGRHAYSNAYFLDDIMANS